MSRAKEYEPRKVHRHLALHEFIPNAQLKLPGSHIVLGRQERNDVVLTAMRQAVPGGNPTAPEGRWLLADLLYHAQRLLHLRSLQRHDRANYWRVVAESWEQSSGVSLLADDVRDIVLAILRAERRWTGRRTDGLHFPTMVRAVNNYLRVNEALSDEAADILIEVRAPKINVFQPPPDIRVPWSLMAPQQPLTPRYATVHQPPVDNQYFMDLDHPNVQSQTTAIQDTAMGLETEDSHTGSQPPSNHEHDGGVAQALNVAGLQLGQDSKDIISKKKKKKKKPVTAARKLKKREREKEKMKQKVGTGNPNPKHRQAMKRKQAQAEAEFDEEFEALRDATEGPDDGRSEKEDDEKSENNPQSYNLITNLALRYAPKRVESQLERGYNGENEDDESVLEYWNVEH